MKQNKTFLIVSIPIIMAVFSLFLICTSADAAPRATVRSTPVARKSVQTQKQPEAKTESVEDKETEEEVSEPEPEMIIENKSHQFDTAVSESMNSSSSASDDTFAEQIRRQRAALAATEATSAVTASQQSSLKNGHNVCDAGLRKCMMETCGNDFTKCATDGDTIFGDKLNKCRRDTECSGEEFKLFTTEIKADRDMNVRLLSYESVINCGNSYNKCIENECGTTYNKCLGKAKADAAIQKCATVATSCKESDSGLASRFGTAIGKLRENAEKDVKKDEERLYALRDLMSKQCKSLGAAFDERSFDCVYTVEFYAGENQTTPTATRKRYAGDSFVCMQEWFGINATTFKENAYRETRAQTAASSAMLGSGVGVAAGLVSSGAIGRALDTQKAKKDLKKECKSQGGNLKKGECEGIDLEEETTPEEQEQENENQGSDNQSSPNNQEEEVKNTPAEEIKKNEPIDLNVDWEEKDREIAEFNEAEEVAEDEDKKADCGVLGKKECGKFSYKICEKDGKTKSCDDTGMLPNNATKAHCVSAGRNGYKICTATQCKEGYTPTNGMCKKNK